MMTEVLEGPLGRTQVGMEVSPHGSGGGFWERDGCEQGEQEVVLP